MKDKAQTFLGDACTMQLGDSAFDEGSREAGIKSYKLLDDHNKECIEHTLTRWNVSYLFQRVTRVEGKRD